MGSFGAGLLRGAYVVIMILAVMILVAQCAGSDAEAQELVKINELDRSLTSTLRDAGTDSMIDMALIFSADSGETTSVSMMRERIADRCRESNELYIALEQSMDKVTDNRTKYADTYDPAYEAIDEARCND